jgi:hypothetical protein
MNIYTKAAASGSSLPNFALVAQRKLADSRRDLFHNPDHNAPVLFALVKGPKFAPQVLAFVGWALGHSERNLMDRLPPSGKPADTIVPAEQIVVVGELSACGLNEGETREEAPVQMVLVGFGNENTCGFLDRAISVMQELAELGLARVDPMLQFAEIPLNFTRRAIYPKYSNYDQQTSTSTR